MDTIFATTLPSDSAKRKEFPLLDGLLRYFPAACAGVSRHSWMGSQKHNKGQEMHHARGKSGDHGNCIIRHAMDLSDLLAARERGQTEVLNYTSVDGEVLDRVSIERVITDELNALCWRSLAWNQETQERINGAPMAPGAKL